MEVGFLVCSKLKAVKIIWKKLEMKLDFWDFVDEDSDCSEDPIYAKRTTTVNMEGLHFKLYFI